MVRTPWPVFTLSMLQADIIGALFVLGFLRFGLPPEDRMQLQDLPTLEPDRVPGLSVRVVPIGAILSLWLLVPVFRWQRRDGLLADTDPAGTELARSPRAADADLPHR